MTCVAAVQPCDKGVIASGADAAKSAAGPWVLAAAVLASSMVFVDGSVVNVALPRMQAQLHASAPDMQWVVESYALMLAALILVGGSLGDHKGRRLVFTMGVIIFAAASLWCGLAPSIDMLILARAVQGVGGALLTPGSLALISANYSGEARGKAIGSWSGWTTLTSAAGPVIGGWLVQHESWRWVFFLNLPLAVAVILIALTRVPESRDDTEAKTPLDWVGSTLVTLGLAGVVFGLIRLQVAGGNHVVAWSCLTAGLLALALFLRAEAVSPNPMMPLTLFRSRTFSGANALTLLLYASLGGMLYFLPFDLIQVHHYTATSAGASLLPFVAVMFLLSRWAGGLVARFGPKKPLIVGPLTAAVGLASLALAGVGGSYWTTFFPAILILGLGMTVTVVPLTTVVMGAVSGDRSGLASGVNNAVSRVASLLAIAGFGLILTGVFSQRLNLELTNTHAAQSTRQLLESRESQLAGMTIPPGTPGEAELQTSVDISFVAGFRVIMLTAALLAVLSAVAATVLIDDIPKSTEERGIDRPPPEKI